MIKNFHYLSKTAALVAASLILPALAYADRDNHGRGDNERGGERQGGSACFVRSGAKYSVGIVTLYGCGFGSWLHASLAPAKERLDLTTNPAKE